MADAVRFPEPPSTMGRDRYMAVFGGVWEHSPWIAEAVADAGLTPAHDAVDGLHAAMREAVRTGSAESRLTLIKAHPDLAGRLALKGELTAESTSEQASAGLDRLRADELAEFSALNDAYKAKFDFPFIIAVRGLGKADILAAFRTRIANGRDAEMAEAHRQIEKIALIRLGQIAASSLRGA
jgi:2-oxo-4-hydroxy-4-carboxy-5-ureidoimidazoline decarboxylase